MSKERAPAISSASVYTETWQDWMPEGWFPPAEEELITRDELLSRVGQEGQKVTTRVLQIWESIGLVPRPMRRWHNGAVRALYAPWVVGIVELVAYQRTGKGKWPIENTRADVRERVKNVIAVHEWNSWGGQSIPMEFVDLLRQIGKMQARLSGVDVPTAEIRLLNEQGKPLRTMRFRLEDPLEDPSPK